jgi:hypothetical protein
MSGGVPLARPSQRRYSAAAPMMDDGTQGRPQVSRTRRRSAIAMLAVAAALLVVACGSGKKNGPTVTPAVSASPAASASPDPTEKAALAAASPAARLASVIVNLADYPAGFEVKKQLPNLLAPSDVPGLPSAASGYFATTATADGNEFVNIIAIVTGSEADAAACYDAFVPDSYLPGLTSGAKNATATAANPAGVPEGTKAFTYTGTLTATQSGALTQHEVSGMAMSWLHGNTFVVIVGASYGATPRTADLARIAAAIDGRLATAVIP